MDRVVFRQYIKRLLVAPGSHDQCIAQADLAWPKTKVAIVEADNEQLWTNQGWFVLTPESAINKFSEIKERI